MQRVMVGLHAASFNFCAAMRTEAGSGLQLPTALAAKLCRCFAGLSPGTDRNEMAVHLWEHLAKGVIQGQPQDFALAVLIDFQTGVGAHAHANDVNADGPGRVGPFKFAKVRCQDLARAQIDQPDIDPAFGGDLLSAIGDIQYAAAPAPGKADDAEPEVCSGFRLGDTKIGDLADQQIIHTSDLSRSGEFARPDNALEALLPQQLLELRPFDDVEASASCCKRGHDVARHLFHLLRSGPFDRDQKFWNANAGM